MKLPNNKRMTPLSVFLLGAIIAFLALLPALFRYDGAYVTRGDYIEQQLPFLAETQRILRNGLDTYSFSTFLGAPAIGSYAFYTLGSPFVWPLVLLPKAALPYGIAVMAVLKHAACMLTAFLYIRKMLSNDSLALLGAVLYTFSSFTVVNTQFYHFTEVIASFPLLLLGFETAMRDKPRPGLLALFCGLNTLVNYYFMLGSALLSAIYVLFRFFSPDWQSPCRLRRFLFALFECITGCALASFLLCPAMMYMLQITRTGSGTNLLRLYTFPDILERIRVFLMPIESSVVHAYYGDAASWTSTAAWLPLFGFTGTACFLFHNHSREYIWLHRLILTLIFFSFIPVLCGIFSLESNTAYTRWWYGLVLMMIIATLSVLDDETPVSERNRPALMKMFCICSIVCSMISIPFLIPGTLLQRASSFIPSWIISLLLNRQQGSRADVPFVVFSLAAATISGLLFLICICSRHPVSFRQLTGAAILVCILAYAGYIWTGDTYLKSGGEHPAHGQYSLDELAVPTLSALQAEDYPDYSRIDYGLKLRNYGLLRGASSLTVFHSLRQSITGRFISLAGFGYDESTTVSPPSADGAVRALLSVDQYYLTDPNDSIPEGFVYDHEENGISVYTNPNRIPMGFLQTVCTGTYDQPMNADTIGRTLLAAITLDDPWLQTAKESLETLDVYRIPDWEESVARLQQQSCDQFITDRHGFTAHINASQSGYLVFTIPFDKGFSASVDGIPAEIIPCDISFMAVTLTSGEHTIRFDFHNRGLRIGMLLSLLSVAVLILYVLLIHTHRISVCPTSSSTEKPF